MSQLKRNIVANYLGQAWVAAMGLAFVPVYIRYLGMEAYGLIGLFAMLQTWLTLLDVGMTPTLNREMARHKAGAHSAQSISDLLRSVEMLAFAVTACIALAIWLCADYLARGWLNTQALPAGVVAQALSVMGLVLALRFLEGLYRGSLYGLQSQVWYNGAAALLATVRHGGAVLVLAWISPSIQAFFSWQVAVSTLTVGIFAVKVHRSLPRSPRPPRFSRASVASVWKFARGMLGITLLSLLLTQSDKVLLSRLLPLDAFGHYMLAATLAGALHLVVAPITQSVYPRMVELVARHEQDELVRVYHRGAQLVTVLTAPAAMLLCFFAGGMVFVWSGDPRLGRNTAPILSALAIGTFLNGLMWIPYQCQLANGWTGLAIRINVIAVALLVPAILWIVPRYGPVAAAWIWVVLNAGYVLIGIQFMHLRLIPSEKWIWYAKDVCLPAAGSILVGIAAASMRPADYQSRLHWLLFLVLTGLIAFAVSTFIGVQSRRMPWGSPGVLRLNRHP